MNKWKLINKNTPKDKNILAYDPTAKRQVIIAWDAVDKHWFVAWSGDRNDDCTHWKELDKNPVLKKGK